VCLEYILVHELVHLLERRHSERFTSLMDGFLPRWRCTARRRTQACWGMRFGTIKEGTRRAAIRRRV
jgi:predicted metal-dependent hydrolase